MQCYCRRGMLWHCLVLVLAAFASADPPPGLIYDTAGQDQMAEYIEPELGVEKESRRPEDDNLWVELVAPQTEYNYWESKKEVTDTGKPEAPQAVDLYVPEIHPVLPKEKKWIPCDHECKPDEYCWEGKCTYRPWKYHERTKYECYPDPSQPGLSLQEKMRCRAERPRYDKKTCLKTKYCVYLSDSPMWYKPFIERWRPPPPQPGGLFDKYIADGKDFAIAAVSKRDVTGAEPLTRAQKRMNAEGELVGGTNTLPWGARGKDNFRNWAGDEEYEALQPKYMEIKDPAVRDGPYPTNTTGPRFSENLTDPYWYMRDSLKKKAVADDVADKAAEDAAAAEEAAEEAANKPPGPAPAPSPGPGPGPAPGPAPAQIASPAFLEIRQIQEHPYI